MAQKQHAHVHGSVNVDVALEGSSLLLMINSPAQSILGFEKKIETNAEKDAVNKVQKKWNEGLSQFVSFASIKSCKETDKKWELKGTDSKHSEVTAEVVFECPSAITGDLVINLEKYSEFIEEAKFSFLGGNGEAKSGQVKKGQNIVIKLK